MKLEETEEGALILSGRLNEHEDYVDLRTIIEKRRAAGDQEIEIYIPQSEEISLYIVGYWLKIARKNDFKLKIHISSYKLFESLRKIGMNHFIEFVDDGVERFI